MRQAGEQAVRAHVVEEQSVPRRVPRYVEQYDAAAQQFAARLGLESARLLIGFWCHALFVLNFGEFRYIIHSDPL